MKKHISACFVLASLSFANCTASLADPVTDADLITLQAAMQSHIDSVLVDGALLGVNAANGNVQEYFPTKAHPKIMTMGEHFVMCSDVVDAAGQKAMANFYIAKDGKRFVVFNTTIGADPVLDKLMQDGKVAMAN